MRTSRHDDFVFSQICEGSLRTMVTFCVMALQSIPERGSVPSGLEVVLTQKTTIKNSEHRKCYESAWANVHNCDFIGQSALKFEVGRCGVLICLECVNMAVT
jgi:hypothetical protein